MESEWESGAASGAAVAASARAGAASHSPKAACANFDLRFIASFIGQLFVFEGSFRPAAIVKSGGLSTALRCARGMKKRQIASMNGPS